MIVATFLSVAVMSGAVDPTPAPALLSTRAGEVAARFDLAEESRRETVEGWYSGRCYYLNAPDTAVGNLLATETRLGHGNEGPIFDRPITKFLIVGAGSNGAAGSPGFFDDMTLTVRQQVQDFVDQALVDPYLTEAYSSAASYSSDHRGGNVHWDMRSDREFHYVRAQRLDTRENNTFCYFFKKVK